VRDGASAREPRQGREGVETPRKCHAPSCCKVGPRRTTGIMHSRCYPALVRHRGHEARAGSANSGAKHRGPSCGAQSNPISKLATVRVFRSNCYTQIALRASADPPRRGKG